MPTYTLRPNGVGSYSQWFPINDTPAWKCVDEVTPDEDGTYIASPNTGWSVDTYALPDPTPVGAINSVTVWIRTRSFTGVPGYAAIRTHSTLYYSAALGNGASYANYSWTTTVNPNTGLAWTWAEIDALEAGIYAFSIPKADVFCTQVWVVVDYTVVAPSPSGFWAVIM